MVNFFIPQTQTLDKTSTLHDKPQTDKHKTRQTLTLNKHYIK